MFCVVLTIFVYFFFKTLILCSAGFLTRVIKQASHKLFHYVCFPGFKSRSQKTYIRYLFYTIMPHRYIIDCGEKEMFLVANLKLMLKNIMMSLVKVLKYLTFDFSLCSLENKNYMCLYNLRNE